MVNHKNETEHGHILTIEDPIEFVHESKKCLINQREVGPPHALVRQRAGSALREDPDVILVGEMRDLETIASPSPARKPATWCSARCTPVAAKTVDRIVDVFRRRRKRWCARCSPSRSAR